MTKNNYFILGIVSVCIIVAASYHFDRKGNLQGVGEASKLLVGGDKDEHGCIGSAGYTWSVIKNSCIRIFEEGIRMNPKDDTLDQTQSAFVVFKSATEYQVGELFLPGHATATIMTFDNGVWADQGKLYRLFKNGNNLMLLDAGSRLMYASDN